MVPALHMPASPDRLLLLERRVEALKKQRPEQTEALDFQALLVRTAINTARPPVLEPFPLPGEQVAARVRQGIPLLHQQPIGPDVPFAADLFSRLVNALQDRADPEAAAPLEAIVAAATGGGIDPSQLFAEAFVQHADHVMQLASHLELDVELLTALSAQAVGPILRAYAERLQPMLERLHDGSSPSDTWHAGYCPICGAWPMLGELRGVELAQWLRCAACGSGWRGQRMVCPYCANDDYRTLGSLTIDGEQRFRIGVCERCKGYLKIGNAFDPPSPELVVLDDTATLHLDLAAIDRGYQRPSGAGFRMELAEPEAEWLDVEELA